MSSASNSTGTTGGATGRNMWVDPGVLPTPPAHPPLLKDAKDFVSWQRKMKSYFMGSGHWPYIFGKGYGVKPFVPNDSNDPNYAA